MDQLKCWYLFEKSNLKLGPILADVVLRVRVHWLPVSHPGNDWSRVSRSVTVEDYSAVHYCSHFLHKLLWCSGDDRRNWGWKQQKTLSVVMLLMMMLMFWCLTKAHRFARPYPGSPVQSACDPLQPHWQPDTCTSQHPLSELWWLVEPDHLKASTDLSIERILFKQSWFNCEFTTRFPTDLDVLLLHQQRWVSVHPCTSWVWEEGSHYSHMTGWLDDPGLSPACPPYHRFHHLHVQDPRLLLYWSPGGRLEELQRDKV